MATDGIYSITFGGSTGSGFGLLVLLNGTITGVDGGGVGFEGTYRADAASGGIAMELKLKIPAHMPLVIGVDAREEDWVLPIAATLPPGFAGGMPISIPTPFTPINVSFTLLRKL